MKKNVNKHCLNGLDKEEISTVVDTTVIYLSLDEEGNEIATANIVTVSKLITFNCEREYYYVQ